MIDVVVRQVERTMLRYRMNAWNISFGKAVLMLEGVHVCTKGMKKTESENLARRRRAGRRRAARRASAPAPVMAPN